MSMCCLRTFATQMSTLQRLSHTYTKPIQSAAQATGLKAPWLKRMASCGSSSVAAVEPVAAGDAMRVEKETLRLARPPKYQPQNDSCCGPEAVTIKEKLNPCQSLGYLNLESPFALGQNACRRPAGPVHPESANSPGTTTIRSCDALDGCMYFISCLLLNIAIAFSSLSLRGPFLGMRVQASDAVE